MKAPTRSARLRIVAWMVLTMTLGFAVVVITVRGVLLTSVATRANQDVVQEIDEFQSFSQAGVDPETARPFVSTARMLEVYLSRQHPGSTEILVGFIENRGLVLEQRGAQAPAIEAYDPLVDQELMDAVAGNDSGVHQNPAGEIRWGKVDLLVDGRADATLLVLNFTAPEVNRVTDVVHVILLMAAGALLVTTLISILVAGHILRPLRLLKRTADEVSDRDLTARIPVTGRDDVSQLARTFNSMLDRLEAAFIAQQRFVDDAGHELRTPITAIRGHLELLHTKTPEEQTNTVALLTNELDRMSRIVNDLLALAKADQPDFVQPEETDIGELTLDLDALAQALADRRWMLTQIADGTAVLDRQRITQAVLQLLSNAVEHTDAGDEIRLASDFVGVDGVPAVRFTVTDTGPGVRPSQRERIFQRFARSSPAAGSRRRGAGLGLAIVAAIAHAHGGTVSVGGEYGQGAVFTLTVPAGDVTPPSTHDLDGPDRRDKKDFSPSKTEIA